MISDNSSSIESLAVRSKKSWGKRDSTTGNMRLSKTSVLNILEEAVLV